MRALTRRFARHLRGRGRALAVPVLLASAVHTLVPRPPERTSESLAAWLGASVGGRVAPSELAWEPRGSALGELVLGRGVWFLAAPAPGQPRDLFRASVRLWPNGQPLTLSRSANLSETPDADERGLIVAGARVLYATLAQGHVAAVTVLDESAAAPDLVSSAASSATTGRWSPLGRTDLFIDKPVGSASIQLEGRAVTLELGDGAGHASYDLERGTFTGDASSAVHALRRVASSGDTREELVLLSRALFGNALTALGGQAWLRAAALASGTARTAGRSPPKPHDLAFRPVESPLLKPPLGVGTQAVGVGTQAVGGREPYLLRAEAPGLGSAGAVELVAIQLEQLELGIQAGSAWPKSAFGVPGDGRLPTDTEHLRRVVAVFNAGPEAAYERYGAMADGRLLVAPEAARPSVVVTRSHRVTLGSWPFGNEVPTDVLAFSQRRTALVNGGAGVPSADTSVRRRSALCAVSGNRLVYAYAKASDPATLAAALVSAGCEVALPLAASPERLGLVLVDAKSRADARFEPLDGDMDFDARSTLTGSTRDFFYLSVRDVRPKLPAAMEWQTDGGAEPPPAWLPGILRGELTLGGVTVTLASFETARSDFRVRPGPLEPGAKGQPWSGLLAADDQARALASIELGHATGATRTGLALGTLIPLPLRPSYATLVVGDGTARILLPAEPVTVGASEQAVQLPLLADDTGVTERARERGDARARAALGVTEDGRVVVASLRHDSSDPLAVGLRAAGCRRIVELDRGSHHPAALERTGTETPPRPAPESTTLWVLARSKR